MGDSRDGGFAGLRPAVQFRQAAQNQKVLRGDGVTNLTPGLWGYGPAHLPRPCHIRACACYGEASPNRAMASHAAAQDARSSPPPAAHGAGARSSPGAEVAPAPRAPPARGERPAGRRTASRGARARPSSGREQRLGRVLGASAPEEPHDFDERGPAKYTPEAGGRGVRGGPAPNKVAGFGLMKLSFGRTSCGWFVGTP